MTGKTQNFGRISAQSSSHNENFVNASKKNTEKFSLLVVNYSTWNLRFVLNILPMIVSEYSILFLFAPGTFRHESFDNCCNWKTCNTILTQN